MDGVHGARELDEGAVPHQLDEPSRPVGDRRVDDLVADRLEAGERPGLVPAHQARISDDIGGKDRR